MLIEDDFNLQVPESLTGLEPLGSGVLGLSEGDSILLQHYEQTIKVPQVVDIGSATQVAPMYHGEAPPLALRGYQICYTKSLVEAYKIACEVYDQQFMQLVERHKTWKTDYQYAPSTLAFQVDGPAYTADFLESAKLIDPLLLAGFILKRVFEFEPNIAAYGLNNRLWPDGTTNKTWHTTLEIVRQRTEKKIAVLAGSEQKLEEMVLYEMGIKRGQPIIEDEVRAMTGFDAFLGPNDVQSLYEQYQGNDCPYLFFGRTSMPKSWLVNPASHIDVGPLAQPEILRYVRAYALTHNFDDLTLSLEDPKVITDTKEAMGMTGSAYSVTNPRDIYSEKFLHFLAEKGISMDLVVFPDELTPKKREKLGSNLGKYLFDFPVTDVLAKRFVAHLYSRGINPVTIANGSRKLRAKPSKLHYGIYGHLTGGVNRSSFLRELMEQIKSRGTYVIQPEFENLHIVDRANPGESYVAIDRVFFVRGADGTLQPMESCRSLMPAHSAEGKRNNVHEGSSTRCARIAI